MIAQPARATPQVPSGVFSIANSGKQPQAAVLANPDVDGVTLRQDWASLEPTEGTFDFSFLDTAVASVGAVGKKVLLRIGTQSGKPGWVTTAVQNAGGSFFTFTAHGATTTIPVFWDATFLAKKTAMIAALGAHFAQNPTVAVVVASFANATSEDWNVPHTPPDVLNWLALGYTSDKLIGAGQTIIDATMTAFPNQIVTLAVGGSGHVKGTNLDPTADYVPRAVVGLERIAWPDRLNVQKNDLSTFIPVAPGTGTLYQMISDFQPDVAGQMVFQCLNDPTYRVNNGVPIDPALELTESINNAVSYKEKYVEIYQIDVLGLPAVITAAHEALTGL
ncbi:MAG: beta-galactosidase [Chthoniobacterales bacterium]